QTSGGPALGCSGRRSSSLFVRRPAAKFLTADMTVRKGLARHVNGGTSEGVRSY
ncbi:unnamed protein product, partial [Ectocarpus sp. 8 AP-2014]